MNQTVKSLLAQSSIKNKSMNEATLIVYAAAIRNCITDGSGNVFACVFWVEVCDIWKPWRFSPEISISSSDY